MTIHIVVSVDAEDEAVRWRACVSPTDGRTTLYRGGHPVASAWYCPSGEWSNIEPAGPDVSLAFDRIAVALQQMDRRPESLYKRCPETVDSSAEIRIST